MNKIKFGLIGCGIVGFRHAEHINNLAELKAICDIKPEVAQKFGKKYACNYYTKLSNLLENEEEIDIISICTPNGFHALHSIMSLRAGKHVLCEKPMALSVRNCEKMIKEAEDANKRLFVVKQNRFNPPIMALRELLKKNKLGRIFSVQLNCFWNRNEKYYKNSEWKGTKELDGGTLFTQFSHFIDLLYWLVGDINKVQAFTKNFNHGNVIEFEDTGVVIVEFDEGAIGTINYTVNSYNKNMEGSITLFCENGTVKIGGQYLNELEYQNIKDYRITDLPVSASANDYGYYQGSMSNHDKVYENVIDVLTNGATISTNFMEGLKTVEIIEEIYKSARMNSEKDRSVEQIVSKNEINKNIRLNSEDLDTIDDSFKAYQTDNKNE